MSLLRETVAGRSDGQPIDSPLWSAAVMTVSTHSFEAGRGTDIS